MRIFGTILAGGEGLRMGADKALMPLAGRPMVAWVAERFAPQVEGLALSANGDPARFAALGLPVLADDHAQAHLPAHNISGRSQPVPPDSNPEAHPPAHATPARGLPMPPDNSADAPFPTHTTRALGFPVLADDHAQTPFPTHTTPALDLPVLADDHAQAHLPAYNISGRSLPVPPDGYAHLPPHTTPALGQPVPPDAAAQAPGATPALGKPILPHVEANLPPSASSNSGRFDAFDLPMPPSKGPLSGILSGLIWAAPLGATALVVVPCDGPFLPPDLVPRLCLAAEGGTPALAISGGDVHPTYSLWPITLLPALQAFLASDAVPRVRDFAAAHGATFASFPPGSFTNANTPDDLARLEARLASRL